MSIIERGVKILVESEERLRALVGEAAAIGEYEAVVKLTLWAKELSNLVSKEAIGPRVDQQPTGMKVEFDEGDGEQETLIYRPGYITSRRRKKPKTTNKDYPKFFRRGNELVKVGWSKRLKSEYQHKSPKEVLDLLIAKLMKISGEKPFSTEDLLPLLNAKDNSEIPDYQVYVCLAWLRQEQLIVQEGRAGYTILNTDVLEFLVQQKWDMLPER